MMNRPHLVALTSLRFFAALHVIYYHLFRDGVVSREYGWGPLADTGFVSVSFFFVLSGFILTYNYGSSVEEHRFNRSAFLWARVARIMPMYLVGFLLFLPIEVQNVLHGESSFRFVTSAVTSLTLVQSWAKAYAVEWNYPAWSLSCEAFFYLAFPILAERLAKKSTRVLVGLLVLVVLLAHVIALFGTYLHVSGKTSESTALNIFRFNPLLRLPDFIAGMALGWLVLRSPGSDRRTETGALYILAGTLAVAGGLLAYRSVPYLVLHNAVLLPAFIAIIYGLAVRPRGFLGRILSWAPLVVLGEASYSTYIVHASVLAPLAGLHDRWPWGIAFAVGLALPLAVGLLFFRTVEIPARAWVRRLQLRAATSG